MIALPPSLDGAVPGMTEAKTGEILEPEAVGELLQFLANLAFNGLSHTEGRGALVGRLGTRVASRLFQIGSRAS